MCAAGPNPISKALFILAHKSPESCIVLDESPNEFEPKVATSDDDHPKA